MTSPNMTDAIRQSILYQLNNVHTALPASIVEYDFTTQKATVQALLNKVWTDGTDTPIPILQNVPVIFPRAGGASLTFPVVSGDTCLLLFIERSIDQWLISGGQVSPQDPRKFDLSDAVAIMGLSPFSQESLATNNSDVLLTYKDSSIRIQADGEVDIKTSSKVAIGTLSTELLDVLSQTLGFLSSLTAIPAIPSGGSPPQPLTFQASAASLKTQLDAITGTIT